MNAGNEKIIINNNKCLICSTKSTKIFDIADEQLNFLILTYKYQVGKSNKICLNCSYHITIALDFLKLKKTKATKSCTFCNNNVIESLEVKNLSSTLLKFDIFKHLSQRIKLPVCLICLYTIDTIDRYDNIINNMKHEISNKEKEWNVIIPSNVDLKILNNCKVNVPRLSIAYINSKIEKSDTLIQNTSSVINLSITSPKKTKAIKSPKKKEQPLQANKEITSNNFDLTVTQPVKNLEKFKEIIFKSYVKLEKCQLDILDVQKELKENILKISDDNIKSTVSVIIENDDMGNENIMQNNIGNSKKDSLSKKLVEKEIVDSAEHNIDSEIEIQDIVIKEKENGICKNFTDSYSDSDIYDETEKSSKVKGKRRLSWSMDETEVEASTLKKRKLKRKKYSSISDTKDQSQSSSIDENDSKQKNEEEIEVESQSENIKEADKSHDTEAEKEQDHNGTVTLSINIKIGEEGEEYLDSIAEILHEKISTAEENSKKSLNEKSKEADCENKKVITDDDDDDEQVSLEDTDNIRSDNQEELAQQRDDIEKELAKMFNVKGNGKNEAVIDSEILLEDSGDTVVFTNDTIPQELNKNEIEINTLNKSTSKTNDYLYENSSDFNY